MTSNAELYRKMAEVVEAVDDVDGVRVDDANVAERVESNDVSGLMATMMGMGGESETQQVIALVVEPAETPDIDTGGFDDPPEGTEIEFEEEAEPEP